MENATKALLIAAAVLIVILLIAFGMRIFNSTSDVSGQAQSTGKGISEQTNKASESAIDSISRMSNISDEQVIIEGKNKYANKGENNSKTDVENFLNYIKNKTGKDNLSITCNFLYTGGYVETKKFQSIEEAKNNIKNKPYGSNFSVSPYHNSVTLSGRTSDIGIDVGELDDDDW